MGIHVFFRFWVIILSFMRTSLVHASMIKLLVRFRLHNLLKLQSLLIVLVSYVVLTKRCLDFMFFLVLVWNWIHEVVVECSLTFWHAVVVLIGSFVATHLLHVAVALKECVFIDMLCWQCSRHWVLVNWLLMIRLLPITRGLKIVSSCSHIFESPNEERVLFWLQEKLEDHQNHVLISLKFWSKDLCLLPINTAAFTDLV